MDKIQKVTLEFEDKIMTISDYEAIRWQELNVAVSMIAHVHGANPFDDNPILWKVFIKEEKK